MMNLGSAYLSCVCLPSSWVLCLCPAVSSCSAAEQCLAWVLGIHSEDTAEEDQEEMTVLVSARFFFAFASHGYPRAQVTCNDVDADYCKLLAASLPANARLLYSRMYQWGMET